MEFWDRITKLPEEVKELAKINITLNNDNTIGLGLEPKGGDIKASGDAMVGFLLKDYILTGIAIIKEIGQGEIEDGIKMLDNLMELWGEQARGWSDLTKEEKAQVLSEEKEENDLSQ